MIKIYDESITISTLRTNMYMALALSIREAGHRYSLSCGQAGYRQDLLELAMSLIAIANREEPVTTQELTDIQKTVTIERISHDNPETSPQF